MNLGTVKWTQWDKIQSRELLGLFICVCSLLCTIIAHNTAQNRPDNFSLLPSRQSPFRWCLFEGKGQSAYDHGGIDLYHVSIATMMIASCCRNKDAAIAPFKPIVHFHVLPISVKFYLLHADLVFFVADLFVNIRWNWLIVTFCRIYSSTAVNRRINILLLGKVLCKWCQWGLS